jgi:hypothetical protein
MHALFGFQLIAVFNSSFDEKLAPLEKHLHLLSIGLVVIAIAIIMTPAAFHRQTSPRSVSTRLIDISTRLILTSMVPLAVAICLDFYVVTSLIVSWVFAASLAVVLLVIYGVLWFLMPWLSSRSTRRLR